MLAEVGRLPLCEPPILGRSISGYASYSRPCSYGLTGASPSSQVLAMNSSDRWWEWVRGRKYHQPSSNTFKSSERPAIGDWAQSSHRALAFSPRRSNFVQASASFPFLRRYTSRSAPRRYWPLVASGASPI